MLSLGWSKGLRHVAVLLPWAVASQILPAPCYSGVLLASLWVNTSRFSFKCARYFPLTFWVSVAKLLRNPSRLFRGPQDCLQRCIGGPWWVLVHALGIPLAPTFLVECRRTCRNHHASLLVGVKLPQWKNDGTDFGCVFIQSNSEIAHVEIKGSCMRDFY